MHICYPTVTRTVHPLRTGCYNRGIKCGVAGWVSRTCLCETRLHKAIYKLKQASRAWYQELCTFLLFLSFVPSCADSSFFVYSHGNALLYFLVYVDDLIITGSDPSLIDTIIWKLDFKFSTKDLGILSYFCGVEVLSTSLGLLLSQQKYVIDLLNKHIRLNSKLVSTPLAIGTSLTANDGIAPVNATMYR